MILNTPSIAKGAKAAQTREQQQLADSWRAARHACDTMPNDETLVKRLRTLEEYNPGIGELRAKVESIIEIKRQTALIKAEVAACDEWLLARKTLSGQKLIDACAKLALRHPERFGPHMDHVRQIGALQIQIADCQQYDMRKTGMNIPTF